MSRMNSKPFIDTNILLYAYSFEDPQNEAATVLLGHGGIISVQVLNEFVDVTRRKMRFTWEEVGSALDTIGRLLDPPVALTAETHRGALDVARRYGFRIFDSLLLTSAKLAGCTTFYSEDMRHGQIVDGVRIVNPFLP